MPLVRARCRACALPLGDPPPTQLPVACGRCGLTTRVAVGGDGQPVDLEPRFDAARLLEWLAYARAAMASGAVGVAVGACPACRAPLVLSSRQPVALACPHCQDPVEGTAGEILVDQWTEPFTHVVGGAVDVEYRLAALDEARGISAGCAACGSPTPCQTARAGPGDGAATTEGRCAACGAVAWLALRPGASAGRLQLAVRVDGTRAGRPFKALVPIITGEGMLRADATHGASARSGTSMLGVTGIGCAAMVALAALAALAVVIAAHLSHC